MRILLNRLHHPVTALGPGRRAGIWLQGCSIGCFGCASADTWSADETRSVDLDWIIEWLNAIDDGRLDGITITGGEPFDQPTALEALIDAIDRWRQTRLDAVDVLCFSGRPLVRLQRDHAELLARFDAIIAGPYMRRKPSRRIWCGSENQRITPLSELGWQRYEPFLDLEVDRPPMQLAVDDGVWLIGIPRAGALPALVEKATAGGVHLEGISWRS
jgi:anaerobic ribonucleoside-triphosphate reductase activating protein